MPSSAAGDHHNIHHSTTKPSDSQREPCLDEDDEEEYEEIEEEIEVEEEVEVEEEYEEEEEEEEEDEDEDDGDDDIGFAEDLSPIDDQDNQNDLSAVMESEGDEERMRSCSSTPKKSAANFRLDNPALDGSNDDSEIRSPIEIRQKEESGIVGENLNYTKQWKNMVDFEDSELKESSVEKKDSEAFAGKRTLKDHGDTCYDSKAPPRGIGTMTAETSKPFTVSDEKMTAPFSRKDGFSGQAVSIQYFEDENKEMGKQSEKDIKPMAERLADPQSSPKSLSPDSQIHDVNKRPAIMCSFFAKGWCIKGKACRFLHIKDHVDFTSRGNEGAIGAEYQKSEIMSDEGLRDGTERSRLGLPDAAATSVAHDAFSSDMIPPWEHGESPRRKSESMELPSYKYNPRFVSSSKDIGRESPRQNWNVDGQGKNVDGQGNYGSAIIKGTSPIYGTSSFLGNISSSSSYATRFEEMATKRSQPMLNDHSFPVLNRTLGSSSNTSLLATGNLPTNDISSWTRSSPFSFSSSWNKDTIGYPKLFDINKEYHASKSASLRHISSPFPSYEYEDLSRTNVSGDPLHSAGYKTKISASDWEPSVPFRPSYFLTQNLSSPGSQYDPIRDSIEQPILGDMFSKLSSSNQGTSILSTYLDPVSSKTLGPEYTSNKHSIYSHQDISDNLLGKDHYEKYLFTNERETVGTDPAEQLKRNTVPKEENLLSPARARDIAEADKLSIYRDSRPQSTGPRHKTGSQVDRSITNDEMDAEYKTYGEVHRESRAWKHFHAALVDLVKELVKPTWCEGHMSKDAYKMIVKKAVDKVLNTLQPHQIPNTAESIKQYLSLSQPKIAKLVEGYIDKYGKS